MKKKIFIIVLLSIGLGAALYVQQTQPKSIFNKAKDWFKKSGRKIKKTAEKAFDAAKDVAKKIKDAGEDVIDAAGRLGKDIWNDISKFPDCLDVVKYGAEWSSTEATIKAVEGSMTAASATVKGIGTVTAAVGKAINFLATKGINITEFEFDAEVAQILEGKTPLVKVVGTVAGQKIDVKVQFHADPKKLAQSIMKEIIKKLKP